MNMISVVVAEDDDVLREHYIDLLKYESDIELLGWASNSADILHVVQEKKPDVVLMDVEMELNDSGITATQKILEFLPDTKVIILTVHDDESSISRAFLAGAVNYVLKSASSVEILHAIKDAYNDKSSLSPCVTNKVIQELRKMKMTQESILWILNIICKLTSTEIQILILLYHGKTQNEICKIRNIELTTVKTHVKNILRKFNKKRIKKVIEMIDTYGLIIYLENMAGLR